MTDYTLQHPKDYYRAKAYKGYVWGGLDDDGLHFFAKEELSERREIEPNVWTVPTRTWKTVRCRESELEDGSLEWLIDHGYTR